MICPNCGHEMPDDHLLCENCGTEINIVPDFEPEIENSINETLSTIVDDITPANNKEKAKLDETKDSEEEELLIDDFFKEPDLSIHSSKKLIFLLSLAGLIVVSVVIIVGLSIYHNYSSEYQSKVAMEYLANKDYTKALEHYEKARNLKPDNIELIYEEALVYKEMGDYDTARDILIEGINNRNMDFSTKEKFYSKIVDIFSADEDYESINIILLKCDDEEIKTEFSEYLSLPPMLSVPTGNYDTIMQLKMEGNTIGEIYYTLDGTIPSKTNGIQYVSPLALTSGEYDIKAVFYNKYNVASEVSSGYYAIEVNTPMPPVIEPESGTYSKIMSIQATCEEGLTIYYTADGSDPNIETSLKYTHPIELEVGNYNFAFISATEDGVCSEIVKRSYSIDLKANVTVQMAKMSLMDKLLNSNYILDINGTLPQNKGILSLIDDTIIEISGSGYYYKLDEYITDNNNNVLPTGLLYAVDIYTGACYRLTIDSNSKWGLIPL